ncbi:hypothetical protein SAMN02745885_01519 [Carboxydocella sporoproducens DSM 16521]|uniref:Uncharacterized protein n=2 Tax=Carboxydocella TaxID=178898 RepID=A0A1T4Q4W3_9FIRM|nr:MULTISPECIES: hypothetical protein [Carboxydocella]AVX21153.1 hypothetical protein CFE_1987 [Carboxydocella thermautotrophica]AVX31588.1 hypothetical protein CTH_2023 [Carboxydocella thermautotrophica]SJZ98587.1 hypothetical protein SAMN02745885_01519 [Carboxydocella sporoproducens DSM 16521]
MKKWISIVLFGLLLAAFVTIYQQDNVADARPSRGGNCLACHTPSPAKTATTSKSTTSTSKAQGKGPHSASFLAKHGSTVVKQGANSCLKCHGNTNFCASCHAKKVKPQSWATKHQNVQKYTDKLSCAQCHSWAKRGAQ